MLVRRGRIQFPVSKEFPAISTRFSHYTARLGWFYRVFTEFFAGNVKKNKQQLIGGHQKRLYRVFFCEIAKLGFVTWKSRSSKSVTEFFACHFTEFFFVFFWPPQRSLDEQTRTGGFLNQPLLFLKRKKRKKKIFTVKKERVENGKNREKKMEKPTPDPRSATVSLLSFFFFCCIFRFFLHIFFPFFF